jgi:hypothetical protein
MDKRTLYGTIGIAAFFVIVFAIMFTVDAIDDQYTETAFPEADDVVMTSGDMTLTKGDLYDSILKDNGLNYLNDMLDRILLAEYKDDITQEDLDLEIEYMIYNTNTDSIISSYQDNTELNEQLISDYQTSVRILGYDPEKTSLDDKNDVDSMFELLWINVARELYTYDQLEALNGVTQEDGTLLEYTGEDYYNDNVYSDVCSVNLFFESTTEAESVFDEFNLVPNYNAGFGLYTGDEDITTLANEDFTEENTTELSDEDVFTYFVKMYNFIYPYKEALPETVTLDEFCTDELYADIAVRTYVDTMADLFDDIDANDTAPLVSFGTYLFDTLDASEGPAYTYTTTQTFNNFTTLVYKATPEEKVAFEDLSDEDVATYVEQEILEAVDGQITSQLNTLYTENNFVIYDQYLNMQYELSSGEGFDGKGDADYIASVGDVNVTPNDLYEYVYARMGSIYVLEAAQEYELLNGDFFAEVYGKTYNELNQDYTSSTNETLISYVEGLQNYKYSFLNNSYATYGFSPSDITWLEFLFFAFGVTSEADAIETLYILPNLQNYLVAEEMIDTPFYNGSIDYMQDILDSYFDLNVEHLIIFLDLDENLDTDSMDDYIASLSTDEYDEFTTLRRNFSNLVQEKIADGETLQDIQTAYEDALVNDTDNEWAPFKAYGFKIDVQDLGSITYVDADSYDATFSEALKRIYDLYITEDFTEEVEYYDNQAVVSDFGIHIIRVEQGTNFEGYSAAYTFDEEVDQSLYFPNIENENDLPTVDQINAYVELNNASATGATADYTLPTELNTELGNLFGTIYDAYFSSNGFRLLVGEKLVAQGVEFTEDKDDSYADFLNIIDSYKNAAFPDLFNFDED